MIINEDSAASYSTALKRVINGNYYEFNKRRTNTFKNAKDIKGNKVEDKFPFMYSADFTSKVLDYFKEHFSELYYKYKKEIADAANDYFKLRKTETKSHFGY